MRIVSFRLRDRLPLRTVRSIKTPDGSWATREQASDRIYGTVGGVAKQTDAARWLGVGCIGCRGSNYPANKGGGGMLSLH